METACRARPTSSVAVDHEAESVCAASERTAPRRTTGRIGRQPRRVELRVAAGDGPRRPRTTRRQLRRHEIGEKRRPRPVRSHSCPRFAGVPVARVQGADPDDDRSLEPRDRRPLSPPPPQRRLATAVVVASCGDHVAVGWLPSGAHDRAQDQTTSPRGTASRSPAPSGRSRCCRRGRCARTGRRTFRHRSSRTSRRARRRHRTGHAASNRRHANAMRGHLAGWPPPLTSSSAAGLQRLHRVGQALGAVGLVVADVAADRQAKRGGSPSWSRFGCSRAFRRSSSSCRAWTGSTSRMRLSTIDMQSKVARVSARRRARG